MEDFVSLKSNVITTFTELEPAHKLELLDELIKSCEPQELTFLYKNLNQLLKRDFIRFLPSNVSQKVLQYLSCENLLQCCSVSSSWNAIISFSPLWVDACKQLGCDTTTASYQHNWKQTFCETKRKLHLIQNETCVTKTIIAADSQVTALKFKEAEKLLVYGTMEGKVCKWDLVDLCCKDSISTHSCADLDFDETHLYTASYDNTICQWHWTTKLCTRKYSGHTGAVFSLCLDKLTGCLITGSSDKTVRLWNISTGQQMRVFNSHDNWVSKVILCKATVDSIHHKVEDLVALSSDKETIRIWPLENQGEFEVCLQDPVHRAAEKNVWCNVKFDGRHIVASLGNNVTVWSFKDFSIFKRIRMCPDGQVCLGIGSRLLLTSDMKYIYLHSIVKSFTKQNGVDDPTQPQTSNDNCITNSLARWLLPKQWLNKFGSNTALWSNTWLDDLRAPLNGPIIAIPCRATPSGFYLVRWSPGVY